MCKKFIYYINLGRLIFLFLWIGSMVFLFINLYRILKYIIVKKIKRVFNIDDFRVN